MRSRRVFAAIPLLLVLALCTLPAAGVEREAGRGTLAVPGGEILLAVRGPLPVPRADVAAWLRESAGAVAAYFGRMPVRRVRVEVSAGQGDGIQGEAWGTSPTPRIVLRLGRTVTPRSLREHWAAAHEFCHLGFPSLHRRHHWMEEGMATWVEPLARARVGLLSRDQFWLETMEGMPHGQPGPGDGGLEGTRKWGRTYWGGAAFWMAADVEIRRRTGNTRSVDDALRAILDGGGDIRAVWPVTRVLERGDRAVGVPVLRETYDRLGPRPERMDLDSLWRDLGVARQGSRVRFPRAPLDWLRDDLTAWDPGPP